MNRLYIRVMYAFARARKEGLWWTAGEFASRGSLWLAWVIFLPVTCIGHAAGFRRLPVITERIGHLAAEMDCFLKLSQLGQIRHQGRTYFLLASPDRVANRCLMEYWSKSIPTVTNPFYCALLSVMTRGPLMRHNVSDYVLAIGCAARYGAINAAWDERAPLLAIDDLHRTKGELALKAMGIPENAWYVCVHARETDHTRTDESVHDYRNVSIDSMLPAMKEIVRRGGWCIRVGDASMKPIPKLEGIIDYVHHPVQSPEMDIFLSATCRFFLGNTSGLFIVSSVFGVPCALTNMAPMTSLGFRKQDLNIFKLIHDEKSNRLLTTYEIFESPIVNYRMSATYKDEGLKLVDNSPEEIQELVVEMLERLDQNFSETSADIQLNLNFDNLLQPHHYCYGTQSKVATTFLRRYSKLFMPVR